MKLVDDVQDWPRWWSVRLSIIGGAILTLVEGFPHVIATIFSTLPSEITQTLPDGLLKTIGIVCVLASPIARVIKQRADH
jgi:preprotein translocase subunit SecY